MPLEERLNNAQQTGATVCERPKVAVILLWYPLFTQPFIFRDVEGIAAHLPTEVHTLYGLNLRFCSQEMRDTALPAHRLGSRAVLKILASSVKLFCTRPGLFCCLFKDAVCRRWPSFEVLGENLWAFLCGVHLAPILKANGVQYTYCPWPRGTTTAARTVQKLVGIPFITCVRANNLKPADPDLDDKMRDAVIVRTNNYADSRRILERMPSARVEVIYNCLTLHMDRLAPVAMKSPVRLLAVGRFDITKGFEFLIQALGILRDRGIAFHLTLAGGGGKLMGLGNLERTIHELVKELRLEDYVDFPGLLSHDSFPDLLRAHDIFVAPCVVAPDGECDGIPNTLIEAMSFGLPAVSTNVNAIPEIVRNEETGLLVPQRDPQALADAIAALIAHPDKAREYGANGAKLARELFSPEQNGLLLSQLFCKRPDDLENTTCAE